MVGGSGREERFTMLYRAHYGKVVAYCRRRLPAEAASDAVAETFLAAWRRLDAVPGDPLLWLYGLARGAVSNQRRGLERSARLRVRLGRLGGVPDEPDHSDKVGWQDPLLAALACLSVPEREALCLCAWEDLSPADAAAVAGCSMAAFKVRLFRARRHMRQLLAVDERGHGTRPSLVSRAPLGPGEETR